MQMIDEVHTLIGAGAAEGAIDAANILKPALARGELQCIGATTLDEYRKHIEKDAALERCVLSMLCQPQDPVCIFCRLQVLCCGDAAWHNCALQLLSSLHLHWMQDFIL